MPDSAAEGRAGASRPSPRGAVSHPLPDDLVELIAERFRVLGEPTRIKLLDRLREGEASVLQLTELVGTTQQNVSKHLGLLQRAGIVARRRRGSYTYYRIVDECDFALCDSVYCSLQEQLAASLVAEAMTSPVEIVEPDQPVAWAAQLMLELDVKRLPVVDSGKLVGIVTRADLMRALARSDAEIAAEIRELVVKHVLADPRSLEIEVRDGEVPLGSAPANDADVA